MAAKEEAVEKEKRIGEVKIERKEERTSIGAYEN